MEYNLREFESFKDYSYSDSAYVLVTQSSNLYYLCWFNKAHVAWENIDVLTLLDDGRFLLQRSYYDVINGKIIFKSQRYYRPEESLVMGDNVIPLKDILRLKPNEERLLSLKDIKALLAFEKNQKVKRKTLREGINLF